MSHPIEICALCPKLCRHACPVAVGTAREAAVPAQIARVLHLGPGLGVPPPEIAAAMDLCVDCGRCEDACHLGMPLPEALRRARAARSPGEVVEAPPPPNTPWIAAGPDPSTWSHLLAGAVEGEVGTWMLPIVATHRGQGLVVGGPGSLASDRAVVVANGHAWDALTRVGYRPRWLHDVLGMAAVVSCRGGAEACCGAAEPLRSSHPDLAAALAARFPVDGPIADRRCGAHLRACGRTVELVGDHVEVPWASS